MRGDAACASMLDSSLVLEVQSMNIVAGNRRVERKCMRVCVHACMSVHTGNVSHTCTESHLHVDRQALLGRSRDERTGEVNYEHFLQQIEDKHFHCRFLCFYQTAAIIMF